MKLLLRVADVFDVTGRGLIVVPGPLLSEYSGPSELKVALRRPDGSTSDARLEVQWFFQTPPPVERRLGCIVSGVSKSDVPVGTEVWYDETAQQIAAGD